MFVIITKEITINCCWNQETSPSLNSREASSDEFISVPAIQVLIASCFQNVPGYSLRLGVNPKNL